MGLQAGVVAVVKSAASNVLVVGGGIAGLAAAVRLAESGARVTLLETRQKLGGRATSFKDVRSGQVLDNCQHVVLGCCTNYLDLLARLGAAEKVRWHDAQYWADGGTALQSDARAVPTMSIIRPGPLPAPAHFGVSMLRAPLLSLRESSAIGRCCMAILRTDRAAWQSHTFGEFLRGHGQSERVVRRFWEPVVVSACNLAIDRVAASVALHVFQEGFLANREAARIGVPSVPLVELYERAEAIVSDAGGRVELGAGVERLDARSAMTTDGRRFEADAVVCAVPVERVNRLVGEADRTRDARFAPLDRFTHSPILGVHLEFDRNVLGTMPHCVLVERPTQWLFRKNDAGTYVHAVISAADDWVALDEREIGERVLADMHACLPDSRAARLVRVRAVKEKLATFAPTPESEGIRPCAVGPSGIILAGDYTDTGWPATMEGAARSGYTAAAAALQRDGQAFIVPSRPVARLSAVLGLRQRHRVASA
ncbi:MAG: hydroxysqualene dehydroxylase HpnE [Phycisphaeraceae bacterium]|nr:hydroxysqualene dehydroxylase HpnE [Phycisphaeraceae bacterium]MBX3405943.1 hydroxysqualene dehydroxylase HpnE [Phycisphaeraceae bacterium]